MENNYMSKSCPYKQYSDYGMDFSRDSFYNALNLIKEAVQDERADELKYDYFMKMARSEHEVSMIKSIRDDERNHRKWFREIYNYYTGKEIEATDGEEFDKPATYLDGISNSVIGELNAVEKYRFIREGLPSRLFRDVLFRVITDEMKHATKYNLILNLHALHHEHM